MKKMEGKYETFVRDRVTQLRLRKGVSEYQMGYDLGHSRSYVYHISSGTSLPPLKDFFNICDYFDLTPAEFFDEGVECPDLVKKAIQELGSLDAKDMEMVRGFIARLKEK